LNGNRELQKLFYVAAAAFFLSENLFSTFKPVKAQIFVESSRAS